MAFWFIPLFIGLVAAASTYQQLEAKRRQQEHQADVLKANALAKEQQAEMVRAKGELERRAIDREKMKVKRAYKAQAGMNVAMLNNVDFSSGSALGMLEGNLNRYADDMGELEYSKDLTSWQTNRAIDVKQWEGNVLNSQADFLNATAGSTGQSLLIAGLKGTAAGLSSYSMIGSGPTAATASTTQSAGPSANFMNAVV